MTNYEHLELPKANIELPKRPRTGGFGREQYPIENPRFPTAPHLGVSCRDSLD